MGIMEIVSDTSSRANYEAWLRHENEIIDGIGIIGVALVTGGLLEAGTPDYTEVVNKRPAANEATAHQLAGSSFELLDIKRPQLTQLDREHAVLGYAA